MICRKSWLNYSIDHPVIIYHKMLIKKIIYRSMMKPLLIITVSVIIFAGCTQKNSIRITGTYKGEKHKYIYIDRVDVNTSQRIDSAKINKQGKFHFSIKNNEPDYYQLGFSTTEFITILATPGENIKLNFQGKNLFGDYNITGSKGSQQVKMLDSTLVVTKNKLDSLSNEYEKSIKSADFDVRGPVLDKTFSDLVEKQRKYNIAFILENMNSLACIKALYQKINDETYVLYQPRDLQFLKIVVDSLKVHYPDSRHTKALNDYFQLELKKFNIDQITQKAMVGPSLEIDPSLPDINGKRITLSSLKGKYVLVTFWSVISQDCLTENQVFKDIYKTYNKKGFEIYQINVDENEFTWRDAIRYEEIPWISVREDNSAKISNVLLYNIQSLPANYLYDKKGNIIGKNIHGISLRYKLEQLLGN
jgi:thiol-disulfide isomerase/thioredoxin